MKVHIHRPSDQQFQGRVRAPGCRKYKLVGKPTAVYEDALMAMVGEFATGWYKRGDVIVFADYYDPTSVCEIVRT